MTVSSAYQSTSYKFETLLPKHFFSPQTCLLPSTLLKYFAPWPSLFPCPFLLPRSILISQEPFLCIPESLISPENCRSSCLPHLPVHQKKTSHSLSPFLLVIKADHKIPVHHSTPEVVLEKSQKHVCHFLGRSSACVYFPKLWQSWFSWSCPIAQVEISKLLFIPKNQMSQTAGVLLKISQFEILHFHLLNLVYFVFHAI